MGRTHRLACEVITEYVKENGISNECVDGSTILSIVSKKYPEINKGNMQPPDICFNRCNGYEMTPVFETWPHALEYCGYNQFRMLGSNFPYTGLVRWNKNKAEELTFGEWFNGQFTKYPEKDRIPIEEYTKKETDYVSQVETEAKNAESIGLEKESLVKIRVNQGLFREKLLRRYNGCALCKISEPGVLIASHIKPWCDSNPEEKIDVNNGFLFCPNHDKLFDQGYISFDDNGQIMISPILSQYDQILMNIREGDKIFLCNDNIKYLKHHRDNIFKK